MFPRLGQVVIQVGGRGFATTACREVKIKNKWKKKCLRNHIIFFMSFWNVTKLKF